MDEVSASLLGLHAANASQSNGAECEKAVHPSKDAGLILTQQVEMSLGISKRAPPPLDNKAPGTGITTYCSFVSDATKIGIESLLAYGNAAVSREKNLDLHIAKSQRTICLF